MIQEVWALFDAALAHTAANIVVLERDSNFTPFENVVRDIRQVRWIFLRHRPEHAPESEPRSLPGEGDCPASGGPDAEAFGNLRNYQRATLREITDESFRGVIQSDAQAVDRYFPMAADWRDRWLNSDKRRIEQLARKWEWIRRDDEEEQQQYRQGEWQAWVRMQGN